MTPYPMEPQLAPSFTCTDWLLSSPARDKRACHQKRVQRDMLHDLPVQQSLGNPEQESRDTSSSSHELPVESRAKVEPGSGKHSVYTHFPKDPNCEICLKTKTTRASCRRRAGTVVPRADNFRELTTAGHRVLSEGSESCNNHRYVVVIQDLATQWIQSYSCKTKTSQEVQKSLGNQKSFTLTIPLNLGKSREEFSWNHCTSTPHRSETHGIAERAVRRVKEGTYAVLLQSGLGNEWWADSMECCCHLRKYSGYFI